MFDRLGFVDERGRQVSAVSGEVFRRALSGKFFRIARGDLARVVYETIENRTEVLYGNSILALHLHSDGIEVELSSGQARQFEVLIGADGLHSRVRELTFGPESAFEVSLGYLAASFIADGYRHRDEGIYVSFARPGRQVSRYAMPRIVRRFSLGPVQHLRCSAHMCWQRSSTVPTATSCRPSPPTNGS